MQKDVTPTGTTSRQYWTVWWSDPLVAVRSTSYWPSEVRLLVVMFRNAEVGVVVSAGRVSGMPEGMPSCGPFGSDGVTVAVKLIVPLNPVWVPRVISGMVELPGCTAPDAGERYSWKSTGPGVIVTGKDMERLMPPLVPVTVKRYTEAGVSSGTEIVRIDEFSPFATSATEGDWRVEDGTEA